MSLAWLTCAVLAFRLGKPRPTGRLPRILNLLATATRSKSPRNMGAGSVRMADELRIPSNPNKGGLDAGEVADLRKGVIHIAFPGSGTAFLTAGHINRTALGPAQVAAQAQGLFEGFKNQTA